MNDFLQMLWTQTWQIAVLAVTVALCTRTVARNRPHLAHALWLLVLIKCVTPPMWGHSLGIFSRLQALTISEEKTSDSVLADVNSLKDEPVRLPSFSDTTESESHPKTDVAVHQSTQPVARHKDSAITHVTAIPAPEVPKLKAVDAVRPDRNLWSGLLLSCLAIGASATLSLMIIRCIRCLQSIHQHRNTEFDDLLNERLQTLSKKLRLRSVPRIIISDVLFGPAVLGVLRHTIVLPRCLLQTSRSFLPERTFAAGEPAQRPFDNTSLPEGAECTPVAASREVLPGRQDLPKPLPGGEDLQYLDPILAHELLHIRRGDLRTGLLQAIVQSLWWFHPAVWFCNRWLSREAERCCDEQVIAELGCSPAQYARSLLSVIESKHALQPIPVFPGMKPVEITSQRMERIMSLKTGLKKQTPLWCWLAVAALAIVVLPGAVAKTTRHDEPSVLVPLIDEPQSDESRGVSKVIGKHKGHVRLRAFKGNTFSSDRDLREHLLSKRTLWNLVGEPFDPDTIPADTEALKDYYQSAGFFDVEVSGEPLFSLDRSSVCLVYTLTEGPQYTIREILCEGNKRIAGSDLLGAFALKPGDHYNAAKVAEGVGQMRDRYIQADDNPPQINPIPRFNEEKGILDLVFEIEETDESLTSTPAVEPSVRPCKDGSGGTNVSIRPVPTAIATSADSLLQLVWETREQVRRRLLSTNDHTPWQIMSGIEGLRRDMLLKDVKTTVNAFEWIQSGPTYQDEPLFQKTEHGGRAHPFSKPYVFEGHINQFFSKLAACRLPLDTQFGTPDGPITIQNMIDHAKMVVNDKEEVTWTLLALCRYLPPDAKWTNAKGEEWSIERLVDVEVGKPVGGPTSPNGGTDGLYALSVVREEYLQSGKPLQGTWLKADEKIRKYIDVAKSQQNPDGTLSSDFFRSSKRKDDFDKRLASSGHLLQFLMHAVSDEQLKEDWIRRAVEATANDIQVNRKEYVSCDPLFTATEALTTYLERVTQTSIGVVAGAGDTVQDMSTASTKTIAIKAQATPETIDGSDKQPLVLLSYPVGELILPILSAKPDFAPLVELIKSTIEPDSWSEDAGQIVISHPATLIIRQTPQVHDRIAKLLSQLLDDIDQVCVRFQLMTISSDIQLKGIQTRCTLHPMQDNREWALLTKERSEEIVKFLTSEKAQVFKWGAVTMFSGTTGQIRLGSSDGASNGLTILLGPRVIADIPVIRLLHSIDGSSDPEHDVVTRAMQDFPINANESLIGSGQTLMLLVDANAESPGDQNEVSKPDPQSTKERFLVLLTVQRIEAQPVQ